MYIPVRPTFFRHMWQRFFLGVLLRGGEEGVGGAGRAERGVAATSLVLPTVPKTSVGGRGRERERERMGERERERGRRDYSMMK